MILTTRATTLRQLIDSACSALLSGDLPGPAANLMIYMDFFDFKSKSI